MIFTKLIYIFTDCISFGFLDFLSHCGTPLLFAVNRLLPSRF